MGKQGLSTKTTHAVQQPYSAALWPVISAQLESSILDLLLPRLTPVGDHRRQSVPVSAGCGRKKRLRHAEKYNESESHAEKRMTRNDPDILRCLTVGFNSTVKTLEELAQNARSGTRNPAAARLCAVLVCIEELPDIMTSPLLLLAATASVDRSQNDSIRLVQVSAAGSAKIAQALNQPKASIVGIMEGAPELEACEAAIKSQVDPIVVPWVREAASTRCMPVKIHSESVSLSSDAKPLKRKHSGDQMDTHQ